MTRSSQSRYLRTAATLVGAALLQACAAAPGSPPGQRSLQAQAGGRQCFLPQQVTNFNAVDDDTVYVSVGTRDIYRMDIIGVCPDIDWSQQIGISSGPAGSWVCGGMDAEIIVPSPTGTQRCPVTNISMLSPAEVQAYQAMPKR